MLFLTDFSAYANTVCAGLPELGQAGTGLGVRVVIIRESDVPLPETMNRESLERVCWSAEEQSHILTLLADAGFGRNDVLARWHR